jgi:hypothetical protein
LNLNLHFHTLVPDGVFFEDADGAMQFHALAPPTRGELEKLLRRLVPRLLRRLAAEPEFPAAEPWLHLLVQALQPGATRPVDDPPRGLCVLADGFSLHAGPQEPPLPGSPTPQHKVPPARTGPRLDWATLLRRSFAIDVLPCERCGGRRRLCALITEENTALLAHLGLPTKAPAESSARAPPEPPEPEGFSDQDGIDSIPPTWYA